MPDNTLETWMHKAIKLSLEGSSQGKGGPFGAVIIKDNQIIGQGYNQVTSTYDPTAHAALEVFEKWKNTQNKIPY